MNLKLTGTGVALVTPFNEQLEVDYPGLQRLISHVKGGNADYLVVMGTTGESPTVTEEEKKKVLQFAKEQTDGIPVVYGIGGNNTREVVKTLRETDLSGVEAILSVSPYYSKPTQRGIVEHYRAVADASPVPVLLYNVPGRTQSNLLAETTLQLAEHPNIIGTKEASGDLIQAMQIARHKPAHFLLISGDDMLTVPMIAFGAKGVISVLANAFPAPFTRMVNEALAGHFEEASQALFPLLDINTLMYTEGNPVGVKQALQELGVCGNGVRLPLFPASSELAQRIRRTMEVLEKASAAAI